MDLTTIIGNCFNTEISTAIDVLSPLSKQTRYLFFVVVFNKIITEKHKPHYIYCLQKIVLITAMLYHLPSILHSLPKHRTKNHLYILDEGVVTVIVAVQAHFIRINHVVIIPHRQFLIQHFVNLLLRKTSALRHQPSDIRHQPSSVPDACLACLGIAQLLIITDLGFL